MTEQISIGKYATLLTLTDEQTAKQLNQTAIKCNL